MQNLQIQAYSSVIKRPSKSDSGGDNKAQAEISRHRKWPQRIEG